MTTPYDDLFDGPHDGPHDADAQDDDDGVIEWTEEEHDLARHQNGETIVVNMHHHGGLIAWATIAGGHGDSRVRARRRRRSGSRWATRSA